jgi:hypothetical protein
MFRRKLLPVGDRDDDATKDGALVAVDDLVDTSPMPDYENLISD